MIMKDESGGGGKKQDNKYVNDGRQLRAILKFVGGVIIIFGILYALANQ